MIRSRSLGELNTALSAAQGEFEAVSKTESNPFYKSKFAPLPEVVKAATPILAKHGLSVWQGPDVDDTGELLWTVVLHSSGQYIGSAARMLPVKNDPQAQGSAQSYRRRYDFMAALGLVADTDDDGEAATRSKPPSRGRNRTRSNPRSPAADGHDEAQETPGEGADGDAPVTTEQLEIIAAKTRALKFTPARWRKLVKEVGAEGKKSNELSEDQGTWVIVKLQSLETEAATG